MKSDKEESDEFIALLRCHMDIESSRAMIEDLNAVADRLKAEFSPPQPYTREFESGRSSDQYNAILTTYTTPRQPTEGPLSDLTFAVKDNISTADLEMTCGAREFSYVPNEDATIVKRLLDAGARLVGKTNMDAFALGPSGEHSEYGSVINPIAPDRVPGGSSSGSAAAVAGGLVDFTLGTETGGSIRKPAACCGLVGVRPTYGRVPRTGLLDLAVSLDTIGPITSDVKTAARILDHIAGHDPADELSARHPVSSYSTAVTSSDQPRFGVPTSFLEKSTSRVVDALEQLIDGLEAEGMIIDRVDVPVDAPLDAYSFITGPEFSWLIEQDGVVRGRTAGIDINLAQTLTSYLREYGFNDHISSRILPAAVLDRQANGETYALAKRVIAWFEKQLSDLFTDVDLLLAPTMPSVPPRTGGRENDKQKGEMGQFCKPFSLTGVPAATVPIEATDAGPISAQVIGPWFKEATVLRGARLIEQQSPDAITSR